MASAPRCVLGVLHYSPDFYGGMGAHLDALAAVLAARGHRLLLAFPRERPWFARARAHGAEVFALPSIVQPLRSGFRADLRRIVAERNVDVVHVHFSFALPLALALRSPGEWFGRRARIPLVYHWHNPPKVLQEAGARRGRDRLHTVTARWGDTVIDRHVTVSAEIEELLLSHHWTARRKLMHVPNGLPGRPEHPVAVRDRPMPFVLGSVANFRPQKDHATLLRAFDIVRSGEHDVVLHLVGDGPTRPEMEALARELGIEARVRFLGSLPDPAAALRAMDAFVLATHFEGHPLVLLEAMSHGLPIIATDLASVRSVLTAPSLGLLVPPRNPEALAEAIRSLVADAGIRRGLAERAWAHARALPSVGDWAETMADLYEELASSRFGG